MRIFWSLWMKLARLRFFWRLVIKMGIFGTVVFGIFFPNPVLFWKQLGHFSDLESLIQTDFKGIEAINRDINALLSADSTPQEEFYAIQGYVYRNIRYEYDWDNWGNVDFWPTAEQVRGRKREDCDGRAVLAVSILRSRGFATAKLVGNIRHIWVDVDHYELMGPDKEQTFKRDGEKTVLNLPSFDLLVGTLAIHIADFPAFRNLIAFFTLIMGIVEESWWITGPQIVVVVIIVYLLVRVRVKIARAEKEKMIAKIDELEKKISSIK